MRKCAAIFLIVLLFAGALPASAEPVYPNIYKYYMELGKLAIKQGEYKEAYKSFRRALTVSPGEKEPEFFINVLKRMQENRIEPAPAQQTLPPAERSRDQIIAEALDQYEVLPPRREYRPPAQAAREPSRNILQKPFVEKKPPAARMVPVRKLSLAPDDERVSSQHEMIYMDDALWQFQPGMLVRMEMKSFIPFEGKNIQKYLIVTPGAVEIERINKDQINIVGKKRGSSFVHIWDDTGRWTFNVEAIIPLSRMSAQLRDNQYDESRATPFRITYAADWDSYYRGPTFPDAKRESLSFLQRVNIDGETPYGDLDSHVIFNKFQASTEVTGYGVGLTDGKIGDFKDFSIRGFDLRKTFSPLSMPGQYVRGVLFEAKAFNRNLEYSYIHGRDRAIYGYLSSGARDRKESFIEGARATLFPDEDNQYSINYARGYGDAREAFLKDQVITLEAQRRVGDVLLSGEVGYDEDVTAITSRLAYNKGDHNVTVHFRDIDEGYTTVASYPSRRGEVGGSIFWNWKLSDININTYLDLYSERLQPNPDATGTVNIDFNSRIDIPLSERDRFAASVYYNDTSGELSPRNSIRTSATYTKTFWDIFDWDITTFIGVTQQRNRFERSSSSDSDRYSASAGLTVPLLRRMNYYANYEYSWVYDHDSGDMTGPNVANTGLSYARRISDDWSVNTGFNYRNEENTGGTNSFLAGEDSVTGSLGVTFRPNDDFEFFVDGRARTIWGQEENRASFNEYDISTGVRTSWETPFRWDPKATIKGIVYKDLNGNQKQDMDEVGIPNVRVEVGTKSDITDSTGVYRTTVRAKTAEVTVDLNTIPDGFIFSTPIVESITIAPHKTYKVNFGLTTQSGIYGVVFYDENGNGKPDEGDEFISATRLILDGTRKVLSDFEGTYFFENVRPGLHEVSIDVNSLPMQYLPKVKIKNPITTAEGSSYVFHIPLTKTKKE